MTTMDMILMTERADTTRAIDPESRFWDKWAERYARSKVRDQPAYEKKLAMTQELFTPGMEVLEVACGTGTTALIHAPFVAHIRAIDFSAEMIRIARGKAEAEGITNITFEQAGFDDLETGTEAYDVIMAHSVFHLLEDPAAQIKRLTAMLKPGGYLASSTSCLGNGYSFFKFLGPIGRKLGLLPMLNIFTRREFEAMVADAGLAIHTHWQPGTKGRADFFILQKPRAED